MTNLDDDILLNTHLHSHHCSHQAAKIALLFPAAKQKGPKLTHLLLLLATNTNLSKQLFSLLSGKCSSEIRTGHAPMHPHI